MVMFGIGSDKNVPNSGLATKGNDEIERLTSKISEVEEIIKAIYGEIGEAYFRLHKDDAENDFLEMVDDVKERKQQINDYRDRINEIKGIIICEDCGAEVKNTAAFCTECGCKVKKNIAIAPNGFTTCVNCNSFIESSSKFCAVCGHKVQSGMEVTREAHLEEVAVTSEKEIVEEPVMEAVTEPMKDAMTESVVEAKQEPQEEVVMKPVAPKVEEKPVVEKVCPSCGQKLEAFDTMCFACGSPL